MAGESAPKALKCPSCGADVQVLLQNESLSAVCRSCGAIFDPSDPKLAILGQNAKATKRAIIALGRKGMLRGDKFQCIGMIVRQSQSPAAQWHDYLLYHPVRGYRWLTCFDGHWTYSMAVRDKVKVAGGQAHHYGRAYQEGETLKAKVIFVLGEFYWRIKVGDSAELTDFSAPPYLLSREKSDGEVQWSQGDYIEPKLVKEAFGLVLMPEREGIAPHQVSPWRESWRSLRLPWAVAAALLLTAQLFWVGGPGPRSALEASVLLSKANAGLPVLTDSFEVQKPNTVLDLSAFAGINNSWQELEVAVVDEAGVQASSLSLPFEYWSGYEGGESWSEGRPSNQALVSLEKPGRYRLSVLGNMPGDTPERYVALKVLEGSSLWSNFWVVFFVLSWPLFMLFFKLFFSMQRRAQDAGDDDDENGNVGPGTVVWSFIICMIVFFNLLPRVPWVPLFFYLPAGIALCFAARALYHRSAKALRITYISLACLGLATGAFATLRGKVLMHSIYNPQQVVKGAPQGSHGGGFFHK